MRERWQQRGESKSKGREHAEIKKKKQVRVVENSERERERERGHVGFGLLVLPSGQLADLFIWFTTSSLLWDFVFVPTHISLVLYLLCVTLKLPLPTTLNLLSRLDIYVHHPPPPHHHQHTHLNTPPIYPLPSSQPTHTNDPTMNSKRQTNKGNCVDVCSS